MAVVEVNAIDAPAATQSGRKDVFDAAVVFGGHYVMGRKLSRKGYSVIGHTWHIVGATVDRWSTGTPMPLCSGFVGYHTNQSMTVRGMSLKYDRICKTCLRVAESRAHARGVR